MRVDVTTLLGIAIDSITCYFREKLKRKKKKEKKIFFFAIHTWKSEWLPSISSCSFTGDAELVFKITFCCLLKKVTNNSGQEQMEIAKNKSNRHIVSNNISIIWTVSTHWDHPRATPLQQRTGLLLNKLNLQNNVCDYYHHRHILRLCQP